jgi:hypothetical protein
LAAPEFISVRTVGTALLISALVLACNSVCLNAIYCYNSANEEINMFAIGIAPGYRLPFTTVIFNRVSFVHTHRDAFNNTWKEPMTMDIHRQQRQREGRSPWKLS